MLAFLLVSISAMNEALVPRKSLIFFFLGGGVYRRISPLYQRRPTEEAGAALGGWQSELHPKEACPMRAACLGVYSRCYTLLPI